MSSNDEVRVLDSSALMNLLALETATVRAILASCGGRFIVPDAVQREVRKDAAHLEKLALDVLEMVDLQDEHLDRFVELAFGMGDGEASVLAYAESVGGIAVVDDGDAHLAFSPVPIEWTIDLMLHERVRRHLRPEVLGDAVYRAGTVGRMRFPQRRWNDSIEILGAARARECPGLRRALRGGR